MIRDILVKYRITDLPTESLKTSDYFPDSLYVVTNFDGFEPPLRRSYCIPKPKIIQSFITQLDALAFPNPDNLFCYDDLIASSNAKEWTFVMQTEMDALNRLKMWTLVPRPSNRTIIKCRWKYAVKRTTVGLVERFRARLVAKGFSSKAGIDFDQSFSPVVKNDSLRTILSIAAGDLDLFQFDVSPAFLYGELTEEIYLEQPKVFCIEGREGDVYRSHTCFYPVRDGIKAPS